MAAPPTSTAAATAGASAAPGEPARAHLRLALIGLVALGAALRLIGLGAEPLWLDEAFSWRWAHLPLTELWGPAARTETNPPLWFTLERAALLLLGESEAALRFPAALAGMAAVPLAFLAGNALAGPLPGLAAAALVATDPLLVAYAQEARGYTLLVAATLLVLWGTMRLLDEPPGPGPRAARALLAPAAGYAIGATLALYAHNTGVLVPALANLVAVLRWAGRGRPPLDRLGLWLVANLVPAAAGLWWLPVLVEQIRSAVNVGWIEQPSGPRALLSWAGLFGAHFLPIPSRPAAALGLLVPLLAAAALPRLAWRALVPVLFALGGPLLLYALGFVLRPVWIERALLPYLAATLALAAAGLGALAARPRLLALLLAILVPLRAADLLAWYVFPQKLAWAEAVEVVARAREPADAVLIVPHYYHWPWAHASLGAGRPSAATGVVVGPPPPPGAPFVARVDRGLQLVGPAELDAVLAGRTRAWLLVYKRRGGDPGGVLGRLSAAGTLEPRLRLEGSWDRGELELFLWRRG